MKQRTISLRIDPIQTRSRVAQFFDSTTLTIVNELLQNARRAGATRVDITTSDDAVTIKDDGSGIKDPAVLLNFGRSHWDPDTLQRELPAGMGLASLARRTATIETRPPGAEPEDGLVRDADAGALARGEAGDGRHENRPRRHVRHVQAPRERPRTDNLGAADRGPVLPRTHSR